MTYLEIEHNTDPAFITSSQKWMTSETLYETSTFNSGKATIYVFKASLQAKIRPWRECPSTALGLPMGRRGQDGGTRPEKVNQDRRIKQDIKGKANSLKKKKKSSVYPGLWWQEMCLLMAEGSVTSCCRSRWETVITPDHFLFPIGHLSYEGNPVFCGVNYFLRFACD